MKSVVRRTHLGTLVCLARCFVAVGLLVCGVGRLGAVEKRLVVSLSGKQELAVLAIDDDGGLKILSRSPVVGAPAALCFDSTGRNLYVASANPGTISVHRADADRLEHLQTVSVPAKPSYLTIDPTGRFLLASYFVTGQVSVHRIVGKGRLSNAPVELLSIDPRAHSVVFDPSGRFVFVSHTQTNSITQFRFDNQTGKLKPNSTSKLQRDVGIGPRHLWFRPDGKFAYGSDESGRSISGYQFDAASGALTHLQTLSSFPDDFEGKGSTSRVQVHPSGKFVYVANRIHGSLAVFGIDEDSGRVELIQRVPNDKVVRGFNITADGNFLVSAGQNSGMVVSYQIDEMGRLHRKAELAVGGTPWWVASFPSSDEPPQVVVQNAARVLRTADRSLMLGQGTMAGETTESSVLLQTRLTFGTELNEQGDLPGSVGAACFEWSLSEDLKNAMRTEFQLASPERDFIVRQKLTNLRPDTLYHYRAIYGESQSDAKAGPSCSFRTLPGGGVSRPVNFIVGSCMNYIKFMHGKAGNAGGPLTATTEDKQLGFPAFAAMQSLRPEFFVGTGDIVYYDNPFRVSKTVEEMRRCWHEQFRFPRMIEFFQHVPAYWSKDDHDYRYNDSDNESDRLPLPETGLSMFREQLPITAVDSTNSLTYRTIRVSRDVQIWMTEGRDFRSANDAPDGPEKTMWGREQRDWLQATLKASDAKWKLLITPTPIVGPDDAYKNDNHATLAGFRHEADSFFQWVKQNDVENLFLICGDRHWQYHSIHPTGVHEFACGALNDENSRMGVEPGDQYGTDPDGLVRQPFNSPEPSGGFLQIIAGETLGVTFFDDHANALHRIQFPIGGSPSE
ncbi:beta-propeller fold lactonase family protein [Rubripirellula reticaptiva]|uniref:6-phosphogluconolactonase n=1 Tax=Rubripirellula reticaptiva TaxID=2528013 RepID=A0A5C6F531_9BACT|nr:beta-propeller fold lactonase family protein [Rubripirellula reticaptiva]TWU55614.1 6-phosphogluconolactonase [Rubripirellula reticaptiva]